MGETAVDIRGFAIRTGRSADLPALQDVFRSASLSNPGDAAELLANPETLLLNGDRVNLGRTRVATVVPDHIVGFATAIRTGSEFELDALFVDPGWMRRGVGHALVQDVVSHASRVGIRRLEVTANGHALAFYVNAGFVVDGEVDTRIGSGVRMHLDIAEMPPDIGSRDPSVGGLSVL